MALLIALEFKHSMVRVALRRDSVVKVRSGLLIAPLARSREFVVLEAEPALVAALAGAPLVLGPVYCMLRGRDDCLAPDGLGPHGIG